MPVTPPAPPLFSTRIGWPSVVRIDSSMMRTLVSTAPPAASGITTVIGFDGKVCASAPPAVAKTTSAAMKIRLIPPSPPISLTFDVGGLDDRPPLVGFGLLEGAQGIRRLLLARRR